MRLLAGAGLNSYRFSIEWSRIGPEPGFLARAAVDHYRRMVDTCLVTGLTSIVTLTHFHHPQWLYLDGGWLASDAIDRFARLTEAALSIVARDVPYVCTINEPNISAMVAGAADETTLMAGALRRQICG